MKKEEAIDKTILNFSAAIHLAVAKYASGNKSRNLITNQYPKNVPTPITVHPSAITLHTNFLF